MSHIVDIRPLPTDVPVPRILMANPEPLARRQTFQAKVFVNNTRYDFFKIPPWKSKVKVMVEVKVESHKVGVTSYQLTPLSFHVNRPSHSWDTAFSKFDLKNPSSKSWVRWTLKVTTRVPHSIDSHPFNSMSIGHPIPEILLFQNGTLKIQGQGHGRGERWKLQSGCNILSTHIPFVPCQSALPFLRDSIFQNLTLKIQGQGQMTMMLHNYRSRQFHRTSNGINPSSEFRDMGFAKSGPSAAWFDKFLAHGQGHMGQMDKSPSQCTSTGLDNSTELRMEKIRQAVT